MKYCITGYYDPHNRPVPLPPLVQQMRRLWQRTAEATGAALTFYEPGPFTIHGDLLSRIWQDIRYTVTRNGNPDNLYVISELDFLPYLEAFKALPTGPLRTLRAVFTRYVTRGPAPEIPLVPHGNLVAPWFIALNLNGVKSWPPLNWLGASGPFNDAANLALDFALDSGFVTVDNHLRLSPRDLHEEDPGFLGLEVPGLGVHCFFSHRLSEEKDFELLPGSGSGFPVGLHARGIERLLARRPSPFAPEPG